MKNDHWYNVFGILKINQKLENEIRKTVDQLNEIISYMVQNHLMHAKNCGSDGIVFVAPALQEWWKTFENAAQVVSDHLVELTKINPDSRVLDIATGIGIFNVLSLTTIPDYT